MSKRAYLAAALAGAALSALAALPAAAAGGPQTLTANLESGTTATLVTSGNTGITCATSAIGVTVNAAAGSAASVTSLTFASCTSNLNGVTAVQSVTANGLPWAAAQSARGTITLTGSIGMTVVLKTILGSISCAYSAGSLTGTGSFTVGGGITLSSQPFDLSSGSGVCPKNLSYSAAYAPFVKA